MICSWRFVTIHLTVVGSALAELNGTQQVGDGWQLAGNTAQRRHLLVGGLAFILGVENGDVVVAMLRYRGMGLGLLIRVGGRRVAMVGIDPVRYGGC